MADQEHETRNAAERAGRALNRLGKWRLLLTGWQLGTRAKTDPESQAVSDHREATLMLRAETSALAALMLEKGVFTEREYYGAMVAAADQLNDDLEERWPGATTDQAGLHYDMARVKPWLAKFPR